MKNKNTKKQKSTWEKVRTVQNKKRVKVRNTQIEKNSKSMKSTQRKKKKRTEKTNKLTKSKKEKRGEN